MTESWDAIVIGSGPNGLAAAIELGVAGRSVLVLEASDTVGGALRSDEMAPGIVRDVGAAIMPFAAGSPFFADHAADLTHHGLAWIRPAIDYSHPLESGRAGAAWASLTETSTALGADADRYRSLIESSASNWERLAGSVLGPMVRVPRHPLVLARYGIGGIRSARRVAAGFVTDEAKALLAGCAAHGVLPLELPFTSAFATLFMASAHAHGWPLVAGGSGRLAEAMAARIRELGGEIRTATPVRRLGELPRYRALIFDTNPHQVVAIAGGELPSRYRARLEGFRYGPGICKVDHVLDGPVPWADAYSGQAGTVHVGGTFDEVAYAEAEVDAGRHPDRPFVLVAQQSLFDPSRTTSGRQVLWSYTHVPNGSDADRSDAIERQIERFAPGFRDRIVDRIVTTAPGIAASNANFVGGDITGGSMRGMQLFARPRLVHPHSTPNDRIFLCSASTPPGGGVHAMGGRWAAKAALAGPLN